MQLIREYIREILKEAAVQNISNMALLVDNSGSTMTIVLYDIQRLIENLKKSKKLSFDTEIISGVIKARKGGFGDCHGAWEISLAAANKGYGPTMYDITMATVPSRTIMPDRTEVSDSAKSIWQYYKNNRSDVEAIPFNKDTNSKEKEGECFSSHFGQSKEYLDYAYRLKGAPSIDVSQALSNHKEFESALDAKKDGLGKSFTNSLKSMSLNFFTEKSVSSLF